jgi:hypothetical protein
MAPRLERFVDRLRLWLFRQLCWWSQSYALDRALKRQIAFYICIKENKRDLECMDGAL